MDINVIEDEFEKRGYELISKEYTNCNTKLEYKCLKHPKYKLFITYASFKNGAGCRYCGREQSNSAKRLSYDVVKLKFEERGYKLISKEYKNNGTKLEYVCEKHSEHIQSITYGSMQQGRGCKYCGLEKNANRRRHDYDTVKAEFEKKGYELLSKEYKDGKQKLKYRCPKHPEYISSMHFENLKFNNRGCPYCGRELAAEKRRHKYDYVKSVFEKNGFELLSKEYKNSRIELECRCKEHPEYILFKTFANVLKRDSCFCPYCNANKGEKDIMDFLSKHNIKHIKEYRFEDFKKYSFDFYLPELNVCIEYDGRQHFEPVEQFGGVVEFENIQRRDNIKNRYCSTRGVRLIRIPYTENVVDVLNTIVG